MRRNWITLILALSVIFTATGCMGRGEENTGMAGDGTGSVSDSQNGVDSRPSQDINGYGDSAPGDTRGVTGRAGYDRKDDTTRRRTAYDYLHDGRYRADGTGDVDGGMKKSVRDLTGNARDMIRDAGDAIGDAGGAVTGAVGKLGRDLRDMARSSMDE